MQHIEIDYNDTLTESTSAHMKSKRDIINELKAKEPTHPEYPELSPIMSERKLNYKRSDDIEDNFLKDVDNIYAGDKNEDKICFRNYLLCGLCILMAGYLLYNKFILKKNKED